MTLNKRREIATLAREHDERINLVKVLRETVQQKEELMSVSVSGSLPPMCVYLLQNVSRNGLVDQ